MSALVVWWLMRNSWSHPGLEQLSTWALQEQGALHTSQISHMRNGKMRMMGVKVIDALGSINCAVWAYRNDRKMLDAMGIGVVPEPIEILIRDAQWIVDPYTQGPLDQGGFLAVYLGYTQIEGIVSPAEFKPADYAKAAARITGYVYKRIMEANVDFMSAKTTIASDVSPETADLVIKIAMGLETVSTEKLTYHLPTICDALKAVDGLDATPVDVLSILSAD